MITGILLLAVGVVLAWFGGSWFVDGSVGLALRARWPTAVIGATVAAFGTSSPEFLVAMHAAMKGIPQVSFGDVLGSSVVNAGLILGLVIMLRPIKTDDDAGGRDWLVALMIPGLVMLLIQDGWFSRDNAFVLLVVFVLWLTSVINQATLFASRQKDDPLAVTPKSGATWLRVLGGLAVLVLAAQFVVQGGTAVAAALGWSAFVVGAVVVAVATSTPELATTLIATLKGHHDVGLSNILGSNIFNVTFIAPVVAFIQPFAVKVPEVMPSLWFGLVTAALLWTPPKGVLGRTRALVLLGCYAAYVVLTLR